MTDRALLDANEAADYLGVSRSYFDQTIRPLVPIVDMKDPKRTQPMWRFAVKDLDAFINSRKRNTEAAA